MCFRPASTTMGARICLSCHTVCDDVSATVCPNCGAPFPGAEDEPAAPAEPSAPAAPGAPQAPGTPQAPEA